MAIIRDFNNSENVVNYLGTVAFFCAISCTIIMLRFRGFKASLNLSSGKGTGLDHYDTSPGVSLSGAYRTNKDELYGKFTYPDPPKRITPSMVKLPHSQSGPTVKPSKSVSDLARTANEPTDVRKSTSDIPQTNNNNNNNNIPLTKSQIKEQKKMEKQRLAEEKKRDKLAAQEQQKQEKLKKEREKQAQKTKPAQDKSKVKKRSAPQPQAPIPPNPPNSQNPQTRQTAYSTNTLESSISKSSGPPPYSVKPEVIPNQSDDTGNTSFVKPINDSGSWDLISQHRQQLNRPTGVSKSVPKQKHLDLHYNVGTSKTTADNSEA